MPTHFYRKELTLRSLPIWLLWLPLMLVGLLPIIIQAQGEQPPDALSTQRTKNGSYEDLNSTGSLQSLAGTNLIVNGGFETGNFTGWTVSPTGNNAWYPWRVTTAGAGDTIGGIETSSPFAGLYSAWNGFCCNTSVNPEYIYQNVTLPASQNAVLTWSDKIQSNLTTFCTVLTCGSNNYAVQIFDPSTSTLLQTIYVFNAVGGANYNTGWQSHSVNLSAYAGRTISIRFYTHYTSSISNNLNGPGRAEIDEVKLTASPAAVYMRSTAGSPWGNSTNEAAMNAVFGTGSWSDLRYETAVPADVFSSNVALVYMEGGDSIANEMETYLNANQVLIENWVAGGGRLFINSAPNEGNGMNLGFGGTQLIYPDFNGAGQATAAPGETAHPIFTSPFTPAGTSYTGGFFSHASIHCTTGCTNLIVNGGSAPVLVSKSFGTGLVLFGGMTTVNFHSPQPNATNLRENILYFLYNAALNTNQAPLAVVDSYSTDEDLPITTNASPTNNGVLANDSDADNNALTAVLVSGPAHDPAFVLNADGSFTYTPEADFNGPDSFTYKANDGTADSEVVTVTITVNAVNDSPTLSNIPATATVPELTAYEFTASAADVDVPADTLTYSLVSAPAGASINPTSGAFSWTPTEAQGDGSTYSFSVRVSDGTANTDSSISITVTEVNSAPSLTGVPSSAPIDELSQYTFTAGSTDADLPAQTLTFSLVGAPAGASIDPVSGVYTWTPNEAQGPGSFNFTVRVSDGFANTDAAVTLTVNEVNSAPTLAAITDKIVDEQTLLSVAPTGADGDDPANTLTYSLDAGYPAGMAINAATGSVTWTPTEAQGAGDYPVTVRVTDNGTPALSAARTFNVHVNEVNVAPVLAGAASASIDEQVPYTFTASATDADLPANSLVFSLVGAPAGASIDPATGVFNWTPTEAQGGNPNTPYTFTVRVTDSGDPALSDDEAITLTVREVNRPPVLSAIGSQTGYWGNQFSFTASATDPDLPANALTYGLSGQPAGASINPSTGAFAWTPGNMQIGVHTFTVVVMDNGVPVLSDSRSVTITVGRRPVSLVYTGDGTEQYSDQQTLTASLVDAGGGAMNNLPIVGRNVGFVIGSQNAGAATDGSGVAATSLILTQDPAPVYTIASSFGGDAYYLPAADSDAFDITREDARGDFTGTLFANTSCATCGTATVTLAATIKDITAEAADAATDGFAGDIRNASVSFINRDTNTMIATVPIGLVSAGDQKVGTANFNWSVNIGSSDSSDFTIGIRVNNYYVRDSSDDNVVVTVSKPIGTNFITGGGYLVLANSSGAFAGTAGSKNNFGFNVKYNKSGKSLQGSVNVIVRSGGRVYQIKGNVMSTLTVNNSNPLAMKATYTGKANIKDITDPYNVISLGGNSTFQMELTDKGEPGSQDSIGINVWNDAGGVQFSSNWNGTRTVEQLLAGGNLLIR